MPPLTAKEIQLLNNLSPGAKTASLGDKVAAAVIGDTDAAEAAAAVADDLEDVVADLADVATDLSNVSDDLDALEEVVGAILPATTLAFGTVKKGVAVIDATDAGSALTQINALLASLRTAGVITT